MESELEFYVVLHNPKLDTQREETVYHAVLGGNETVCGWEFKRDESADKQRWKNFYSKASIPPEYSFCENCDMTLSGSMSDKLDAVAAEVGFERSGGSRLTKDELDKVLVALREHDHD